MSETVAVRLGRLVVLDVATLGAPVLGVRLFLERPRGLAYAELQHRSRTLAWIETPGHTYEVRWRDRERRK